MSKRTFLLLVIGFLTGLVFGSLLFRNIKWSTHNAKKCYNRPSASERRPQIIIQELGRTWLVFIGVLINTENPAAKLVYKDWTAFVSGKIVFFIMKRTNLTSSLHNDNLTVVYLQDGLKSPMKYSTMLRYISKHYLTQFKWFMLTDDHLFINADNLYFLRHLNYLEDHVLAPENGKPGTHLFISGTIISRSFLQKISHDILQCAKETQKDMNKCYENTLTIQWLQSSKVFHTTDNSDSNICSITNDRLATKIVTADLSRDADCMYRLHIQVLSHKLLNNDMHYMKLKHTLNKLKIIMANIHKAKRRGNEVGSGRRKFYGSIFTIKKIFSQTRKISWRIRGREKEGITWIIENVMDKIREVHNASTTNVKFHTLYYGYMSIKPVKEIEYNLNIYTDTIERHTITSRHVFGRLQARTIEIEIKEKIVSIIVPLAGRLEIYKQFLESLEKNILKKNEHVRLLIIYFPEKHPPGEHLKMFENYKRKYPKTELNWLNLTGEFARARALQAGVKFYKENSLMFFADIDLMFNSEFLRRCKSHCISGKRVYFPVMFKLFNPRIRNTTLNSTKYFKSFEYRIGDWRYYSFGPVCAHKNDVEKVGGFNVGITQWGYEDVQFFERFLSNKNYELVRTVDPGLIHVYHPHAKCGVITNVLQRRMCMAAMLDGLASQDTLLKYLLEKRYLTLE